MTGRRFKNLDTSALDRSVKWDRDIPTLVYSVEAIRIGWPMLRFLAQTLLFTVLLCRIESVRAASPTQLYLAARDRYIATETAKYKADTAAYHAAMAAKGIRSTDEYCDKACLELASAREKQELGDLERQLRRIVGSLDLDGFPGKGTITLTTLVPEIDFGTLDGLAFDSPDKNTRVVVTTNTLLESWLMAESGLGMPRNADDVLRSEIFYTQAINDDAAFYRFAEIPVSAPSKARLIYAMLVQRSQDFTLGPPDEIIVTVVHKDKTFIVSRRNSFALSRMAVCDAIARDYEAKEKAALDAYDASKLNDKASFDRYERLQNDGDIAYRQCFGKHVNEQPAFTAIVHQVRDIVKGLS
jgi:hypothetical protein